MSVAQSPRRALHRLVAERRIGDVAPNHEGLSGSVGFRYATADRQFNTPLALSGQNGSFRYAGGLSLGDAGDLRGGGNVGVQDASAYRTRSGYASAQYLLTNEKTIAATYSDVQQRDVQLFASGIVGPIDFKPTRTRLASLSYLDLTSRSWADSLRASAYWNRQTKGVDLVVDTPRLDLTADNGDALLGAGIEGGKFLGSSQPHHLVYGIDFSTETTQSKEIDVDPTGKVSVGRSDTIPGSRYQTIGVYLQDRFDIGKRLTASVGARYGVFSLRGPRERRSGEDRPRHEKERLCRLREPDLSRQSISESDRQRHPRIPDAQYL